MFLHSLFSRDTDSEILEDLEEVTNLLHQHSGPREVPDKAKLVYQLYHFGRQVTTENPNEVTRILAHSIEGGRLYSRKTITSLRKHQMYGARESEKQYITRSQLTGSGYYRKDRLDYTTTKKGKLPLLLRQQYQLEESKSPYVVENQAKTMPSLWKFHHSSSENSDSNAEPVPWHYTRLSAYRYSRTPHVASRGYPLTKGEVEAVERFLETVCKKTSTTKWTGESKTDIIAKKPVQKKSSGLDQDVMNALFADPEAMHVLRRNPAAVLEQLRRRIKPGELTHVLDEVMRETGGIKSKKVFLQALQKAVHLEKETKQQLLQFPTG